MDKNGTYGDGGGGCEEDVSEKPRLAAIKERLESASEITVIKRGNLKDVRGPL